MCKNDEISKLYQPNNFINRIPPRIYSLNCDLHGKYYSRGTRSDCPTCLPIKCFSCDKHTRYLNRGFCSECVKNLPKTFELNEWNDIKAICICNCETHGTYLGGSSVAGCPVCMKINLNKCMVPDCDHPIDEKYFCINHNDILNEFPENFDLNSYTGRVFMLKCENCGYYASISPVTQCSNCKKCLVCNLESPYYKKICIKCFTDKDIGLHESAEEIKLDKKYYILNCEKHGDYISFGPVAKCNKCKIERNRSKNVKYYWSFVKENLLNSSCMVNKDNYKLLLLPIENLNREKRHINCVKCNRLFNSHNARTCCGRCHVIHECIVCKGNFLDRGDNPDAEICSRGCVVRKRWLAGEFDGRSKIKSNNNKITPGLIEKQEFDPSKYTLITDEDIEKYKNVSGIWLKYSREKDKVLDVCITTDIMSEILYHYQEIENKQRSKYMKMSEIENIEFYYIESFNTWDDGLIRELEIALSYEALFWSPAPGIQMTIIKQLKNRK